ncbi:helix-turn-helix domain-containing protein [Flavobacterium sp.]|jgi:transcriptional regulator with XRE-family HTH domain|uniref:helix-turn-helix domain-containing protein n=1 Tax=Flavobacterium sp. TaxID=239 RepID=UPI0037C05880
MGVGTNIKRLRSKTKLSQQDVADLVGVDKNTYANWENQTNDIKSEHIPKLAQIFHVEIKDLFDQSIPKIEININKQVSKDKSLNNSVVLVMPDKETVEKLIAVIRTRFDI